MTTATRPSPSPRTPAAAMLRAGTIAGLVVAALMALVSFAGAGTSGLAGSLTGSVLVGVFFATSFGVLGRTRNLDPAITLVVALGLYVAKVVALVVVLALLTVSGALDGLLDRTSLAVTIIVATLVWSVVEILTATRQREPMYDLGQQADPGGRT